jgi:hypothetical protein
MKTFTVIIALVLASSWCAFGKANFYSRTELIQKATAIAIVQIEKPEPAKPTGNNQQGDPFAGELAMGKSGMVYRQQAKVRVQKVLKGDLPKEFTLYGQESFICAGCVLTEGRFLAFLTKDGDLWVGANWHLSLRPIQNEQVEWYVTDEQRYPMKFQDFDDVVAEVLAAIQKHQSEQGGADQPATAPESKPDGIEKPQPESKPSPR